MKTKILKITLIFAMLMLFTPLIANADEKYGDYLYYSVNTSIQTITITDCDTSVTEIEIPNEIDSLPVTSIGYNAFYNCSSLTSITIPNRITSIGQEAFYNCDRLTDVYYSGSYKDLSKIQIGSYNNSLAEATIYCSDITAKCWGKCGDTVGYFLSADGTLTISGEGNMSNYSYYSYVPWYSISSEIQTVIIEDGVTSIGDNAFNNCSSLTSFTIPDVVTSIGDNAFDNCSGLTSITIPNSITSIGDNAFNNCSSLTSFTIPNSVTSIGDKAFYYCDSLKDVYYSGTFSDFAKVGTDDYSFSSAKTKLHCTDITADKWGKCGTTIKYYFDENGTAIIEGTGAMYSYGTGDFTTDTRGFSPFRYCHDVVIKDGVTNIGTGAFHGGNLSITIPDSVTYIDSYAFDDCDELNIHISNLVSWCNIEFERSWSYGYNEYKQNLYINDKLTTDLVLPDSLTSISSYAFYDCNGLTSVTIPDSVTTIGNHAFSGCSNLDKVYISDLISYLNIDFKVGKDSLNYGYEMNYYYNNYTSNPMYYANKLYINNKRVIDIEIPNEATKIPFYAFNGCDSLKKITIPDSVTSIGAYAFGGCSGLTDVVMGTGITNIETGTFKNCTSLTNIEIPNGVTDISGGIYVNLRSYVHEEPGAFEGCTNLTSITIPKSVTSIDGPYAFSDCNSLENVYISDLTAWCNIDFGSYSSNPLRNKLYINNRLATEIVIPDNITEIKDYVFCGFDDLKKVTIPDGVTNIGNGAFNGCDGLTSVTIPDSVTNIGNSAFSGCDNLTHVTIPDSVTNIGNSAFSVCSSLTHVTIPDSVTNIGSNAFSYCDSLTSVTIPESVTSIGNKTDFSDYGAFNNCRNLTTVNYNAIDCAINSDDYFECYLFYNCSSLVTINIGDKVKKIPDKLLVGCNSLLSLAIGNSITNIDTNTLAYCRNLKKIFIPKSVTEIEKAAFKNCSKLTNVEYGGSQSDWEEIYIGMDNENLKNANINYNSLSANAALTDLDYLTYTKSDDNTITITDCNTAATSINIPKEIDGIPVTSINTGAFENCTILKSVTIPDSVTTIGERAFNGCSSLTGISIPDGITAIGSNTFSNCSSLKNITIPDSVTTIGYYAFYGCNKLTDVYYSDSEEQWKAISINYYGNSPLTSAKIYYNGELPPPPITVTDANVTKTETSATWNFEVSVERTYEDSYVYAVTYGSDGSLIAISQAPLNMSGSTSIDIDKSGNDAYAKIFVWTDIMQPITYVKEIKL